MDTLKFFDSVHSSNKAANFIEKYLYLEGISEHFGDRKFSVYGKESDPHKHRIKESPAEKGLTAGKFALTTIKIVSYFLSFFILPAIVVVAKAIYRSKNQFTIVANRSQKNEMAEKIARTAIGLPRGTSSAENPSSGGAIESENLDEVKPIPGLPSSSSNLLKFYRGEGVDSNGRSIQQLWCFSLEEKERCHDYIQWLFPLKKPSQYNQNAPLLDAKTIAAMRQDPLLMANIQRSFKEMLTFYGLRQKKNIIERAENFPERKRVWLTPNNHNHLRLTRILRCLTLLGLTQQAKALSSCLKLLAKDYPNDIGKETVGIWGNI